MNSSTAGDAYKSPHLICRQKRNDVSTQFSTKKQSLCIYRSSHEMNLNAALPGLLRNDSANACSIIQCSPMKMMRARSSFFIRKRGILPGLSSLPCSEDVGPEASGIICREMISI